MAFSAHSKMSMPANAKKYPVYNHGLKTKPEVQCHCGASLNGTLFISKSLKGWQTPQSSLDLFVTFWGNAKK
jgi:hypothetical protein